MIASHYAEPVQRWLGVETMLHSAPSAGAEGVRELRAGEGFMMLDESLGWSWGYATEDGRVGYVSSGSLEH